MARRPEGQTATLDRGGLVARSSKGKRVTARVGRPAIRLCAGWPPVARVGPQPAEHIFWPFVNWDSNTVL